MVAAGLIAAVIAGAVVGVVLVTRPAPAMARTTPAPRAAAAPSKPAPPTVAETIMAEHATTDGVLDLEGSLQLFAYVFGPLPGVSVPQGTQTDSGGDWADLAAASVVARWNELTAAQQQAVLPYFQDVQAPGSPSAGPSPSPSGSAGPSPSASAGTAASHQATRSAPRLDSVMAPPSTTPGQYVRDDLQAAVLKAFAQEGAKLGHGLADSPVGITTSPPPVSVVLSGQAEANQAGGPAWTNCSAGPPIDFFHLTTLSFDHSGKITECYIFFGPAIWSAQTADGHWAPTQLDTAIVYHEVFHAYQFFVLGSTSGTVMDATPRWVIEGGADWAAASILPFDEPAWSKYLSTPTKPLYQRDYDGFGLFFEIEYLGRPLWPQWWSLWTAAANSNWGTGDWYDQVAGGFLRDLNNAWGSSFYLDRSLGHDWTLTATGQMTGGVNPAKPLAFSGSLNYTFPPFSTLQIDIPAQSSNTVVWSYSLGDSVFRFEDSAGKQKVGLQEAALCWGQCQPCPSSSSTSPPPGVIKVTGLVHWAATGEVDGQVELDKEPLDTYCKQQNPPPAQSSCDVGCAETAGDPHLTTVDGRLYDFQAAGEYVLLRSPDGSVEIQARQEPFVTPEVSPDVAVNTALAARVGSHRVEVQTSASGAGQRLDIDGKPVDLTSAMNLSGGGEVLPVTSYGIPGYEIDFPDGTVVWSLGGSSVLDFEIQPSQALRTDGTGILGPIPAGDFFPLLPDGTGSPGLTDPVARYDYEYQRLAPAWRVTDATSLFDYDPGMSTASYDHPGYEPEGGPPPHPFDANAWAAAEGSCAAVKVAELGDDCAYDVAVTGDSSLASDYANLQSLFQPPQPSQHTTPTPAPSSATLFTLEQNVSDVKGEALGPDGTLYILYDTGNTSWIAAVDPSTDSVVRSAQVSDTGVLPGLAFTAGSLWILVPGLLDCHAAQVDPTSLAVGVTIPVVDCPADSIGGNSAELWVAGYSQLEQLDVSTRSISERIPLPSTGTADASGQVLASSASIFFSPGGGIAYRVEPGGTLTELNTESSAVVIPVQDGVWEQGVEGLDYYDNSSGTPSISLGEQGVLLVGADANNLYVVNESSNAVEQHPIIGGPARVLGTSTQESYIDWIPLLIDAHDALHVLLNSPGGPGTPGTLELENFPLP